MKNFLLLSLCAGLLMGCTSLTGIKTDGLSCPHTGLLKDHDRSTFILNGVTYETAMGHPQGTCFFPNEQTVEIKSRLLVGVRAQDPVTGTAGVQIPYSVTVLDADETIVSRQDLTAALALQSGNGAAYQPVNFKFPVPDLKAAAHYKVIYNFNVNQER